MILLASVSKALGHCTVTLFVPYLSAQKEGIKSSARARHLRSSLSAALGAATVTFANRLVWILLYSSHEFTFFFNAKHNLLSSRLKASKLHFGFKLTVKPRGLGCFVWGWLFWVFLFIWLGFFKDLANLRIPAL